MLSRLVSGSVRRSLRLLVAGAVGSAGALCSGCRTAPQQFDSPEQAVDAVVSALRPEVDRARLLEIFGSDAKGKVTSGDKVADSNAIETFLHRFDQSHWIVEGEADSRILEIGDNRWPFPFRIIPLDGRWEFDIASGIEEVANRRLGENELDSIQALLAVVDAQREYAWMAVDGDGVSHYARKFVSDPGTRNGLFWPNAPGEPFSPLGDFAEAAVEEGHERGNGTYHGYRFRILTAPGPGAPGGAIDYMVGRRLLGRFAVVAWPAEYGKSGVKTFIANHMGVVHERDLGPDTAREVGGIKAFDPEGWEPVADL